VKKEAGARLEEEEKVGKREKKNKKSMLGYGYGCIGF
jgi:hypothetical protein